VMKAFLKVAAMVLWMVPLMAALMAGEMVRLTVGLSVEKA
jgi:hypothetical protein